MIIIFHFVGCNVPNKIIFIRAYAERQTTNIVVMNIQNPKYPPVIKVILITHPAYILLSYAKQCALLVSRNIALQRDLIFRVGLVTVQPASRRVRRNKNWFGMDKQGESLILHILFSSCTHYVDGHIYFTCEGAGAYGPGTCMIRALTGR